MFDPVLALGIALAGGSGSVLRLALGRWRGTLPWGTLVANLLAGLVLGLMIQSQSDAALSNWLTAVIFVGFAGGLSTFSSVAAETGALLLAKKWDFALANLAANLFLPVLTVWVPVYLLTVLIN